MRPTIETTLSELRDRHEAGRADDAFVASLREQLFALPGVEHAPQRGLFASLLRLPKELTDMVARPAALASLFMVMVLGGWIGSVNASLDTLPGDTLYPVKLVSERAQLTLATSSTKGRLHAEFATRRLNEVAVLVSQSPDTPNTERVKAAVDGFHKQITGVEQSARSAKTDADVIELARIVDRQVAELETVLEIAEDAKSEEGHGTLVGVITDTEQTKGEVVNVLIERSGESDVSKQELARQFRDGLNDITARVELLKQRVDRVEAAIAEREREDVVIDGGALRFDLGAIDMSEAMNYAAQGGYTRAFELLTETRAELRRIASELALAEIALTRDPVVEQETDEITDEGQPHETHDGSASEQDGADHTVTDNQ